MSVQIDKNKADDETLWQLLLQGQTSVLEILYRRHYDLLLNYGLKCCPDKELVKDCIQDLFVKLHESHHLSPTDHVNTYLLRALKNHLNNKLSAQKEMENIEDVDFQLMVDDSTLETLFQKDDEALRLSRQLLNVYRQLPENRREAIYLRYVRGMSYKEIAEILGITPQSGMNLVQRALTQLRSVIQSENLLLLVISMLNH